MSPPDSSRQFARLAYEALFARAAGLLGGFAANVLVARSLGAEGKGLLTILAVWSGLLAALFSSGVHLATVYELGRNPGQARRLLSAALPYALTATLLVVGAVFLSRNRIGYSELSLVLLASLFAAQLLCNLSFALLIGLRRQSVVNWLLAAGALAYPLLVAGILLFRDSLNVLSVALCMVGLPAVMALVGFSFSQKTARRHDAPPEEQALAWPPFLHYAIKSTAMTMGSLLYLQIVLLILSARSSPEEVGVFSVAMMFADTAIVIPAMISSFVLPRWAGLSRAEIFIRAGRVIRLTHPISLIIAGSTALVAMILAEPVFGKDFAGAGALAWIMAPGAWAATGITVISHCFLAQNRLLIPVALTWVGTLLCGVLTWYGLPQLGCAGAAMAVSLSRLMVLLLAWGFFAHANRLTPQAIWIPGRNDFQAWKGTLRHSLLWLKTRL